MVLDQPRRSNLNTIDKVVLQMKELKLMLCCILVQISVADTLNEKLCEEPRPLEKDGEQSRHTV